MHDRQPLLATKIDLSRTSEVPLTAAAALALIAGWTDLPALRRRDLASAVNAVVRAAGLPPDAVALTPAALRVTLLNRAPRALGMGEAAPFPWTVVGLGGYAFKSIFSS